MLCSVWVCCVLFPGAEPASLIGVALRCTAGWGCSGRLPGAACAPILRGCRAAAPIQHAPSRFWGSHVFPPPPPRFYPAGSPSVRLWRLAGVGAFLCRESAAQRNSHGAAGTRRLSLHFEFQAVSVQHEGKAALGVKKGFSFTLACMTCLCTLLAVFMKVVKIPTDLVGSAAPPEDQELLSFINIHSYYLKHTLWCLLGSPVPYIMRKVT